MSRQYWQLRESPFRGTLDPRFYFPSPSHEEALARLDFLVGEQRRLGLLLGESGVGKSLTLEVFARRLRRQSAQIANVNLLGVDLHEFLWLLAAELGTNPDRGDDTFRLWRQVIDRLAENRYQQLATVVLLDDGDESSHEVLEHIVRLAQFDRSAAARLTIILASGTNTVPRILPRLLELADLRCDIEAWEPADTMQYIKAALEHGGSENPIFTDEALNLMHDLCEGIPRRVNQLADLTLFAGAGRKLAQIDADTVDSAYHELAVVEAAA